MLIPIGGFPVKEHDATIVVTPTSRFGHESDTVLATVEMQIVNAGDEEIRFPFAALNTDPGSGADSDDSTAPKVINGSREVEMVADELDEDEEAQLIDGMAQRAEAAGVSDPAELEKVRDWARSVIGKAERIKVGRTKIGAGESRRIILQQRIRVLPDDEDRFILETIAPSPAATLATGGRVSIVALLPWKDDDVNPELIEAETTQGFNFEKGPIKERQWVAWHWQNDPVFRLAWRYA